MNDTFFPISNLNEQTIELINEFCTLAGKKTWSITKSSCFGKYKGTYDYSILFNDGIEMFISNGMSAFHDKVAIYLKELKTLTSHKETQLALLRTVLKKDNELADNLDMKQADIIDIGVELENQTFFMWPYVHMVVDGVEFKHIESGLCHHLSKGTLHLWIEKKKKHKLYTAGGLQETDYIFGNVRFSTANGLYKIR